MDYFLEKRKLFLLVIVALLIGGCLNIERQSQWKSLFDGKTLNGWEIRSGFAKYHVEDGAIVGTTVKNSPNTFLCTKKQYSDFILEFEVKVNPVLNSGVQFRSNVYETEQRVWFWRGDRKVNSLRKPGRVYGYQVEIANEKNATSGGIYDEARLSNWLQNVSSNPVAAKAFKDNQWNRYRVECIGDSIKTWVNSVPCADLRDSRTMTGFIGLQVHSFRSKKPAQVRWRNIRIKNLGKHVWKPLFDGKTFAGWHTLPGGKWEIHDGVIDGSSKRNDKLHGLLASDKQYGNFTVRLKFKAIKGNSGFYFRSEEVEHKYGIHGFQAEIDEIKDVGGLYETAGRKWVSQPKPQDVQKWFNPQQWNDMTVSAHGGRIVVHVNSLKSVELKNDPGRKKGHFALQLHGGQDVNVQFKDIEILVPEKKKF